MDFENQELIITHATIDDAPIILSLWKGSAEWLQSNNIKQWNPEAFSLEQVLKFVNDGSDVYLATIDNEIAGTYLITWQDPFIWKELDNSDAGYIHKFAVNRKFKGKGIGSKLLRSAEEQIRDKGKKYIRLDCMADNNRLNQYYRDAGYQFVRRLDSEGWSAHLYEKR
ncbi:GNAT family N-acetyltransferase [Paenibacillus sp. GXUN7292]|uniref:GNAT family N-acetyltransferase n=1 Tax=Paenibacillus sp. GXUN7292 TaxID=3422499 RepID=UPI003D7DD7B7